MDTKRGNERYKLELEERKRRMWNDLREDYFRKYGTEHNAQFDIPNDLEDLSVIDHLEDLGLTISGIRKEELVSIEESLRRIEDGTYGRCAQCGAEIGEERLKAQPYAIHCLRCKGEMEAREGGRKPTL
ncbi:MAG TPA: TraR/DksA C4-type zinc finger protein [Thermodesulfobacteriota bacterium]